MNEKERELIESARLGNIEKVTALVNTEIDVNIEDDLDGYTALHWASRNGFKDIVEILIKKGAKINPNSHGHQEKTTKTEYDETGYYSKEVPLYIDRNKHHTPLFLASKFGRHSVVELLIFHGADINTVDNEGNTPLILAAGWSNHIGIVNLLINAKVDVNKQNNEGDTALIMAALFGNLNILKLLIESNADISVKSNVGRDVFDRANISHNNEIMDLLKRIVEKQPETAIPCAQFPNIEKSSLKSVFLNEIGPNRIKVIKEIQSITGLNIVESNEIMLSSGKIAVREGIPTEDAEKVRSKLEDVGAIVEIREN